MARKPDDQTRLLLDWDTGIAYGFRIDSENNCVGFRKLSEEPILVKPNSIIPPKQPAPPSPDKDDHPYGQTSYMTDQTGNGGREIFTVMWPSKEDMKLGHMPHIGVKALPRDLIKAGIANYPDSLKSLEERFAQNEEGIKKSMKNLMELPGLESVKKEMEKFVSVAVDDAAQLALNKALGKKDSDNVQSFHTVLFGGPGTGKTTVAREMAEILHASGILKTPEIMELRRSDLVGGYIGQSENKTKEILQKAAGKLLFIDEIYSLASGGDSGQDFGKRVIEELIVQMENKREDFVLAVAGYTRETQAFLDSNPGLKSRFSNFMFFEDYTTMQLGEIRDYMLSKRGKEMAPEAVTLAMEKVDAEKVRDTKNFANARVVRNLVEAADKARAERMNASGVNKEIFSILAQGPAGVAAHKTRLEELDRIKNTITLEDVETVNLYGIASKGPARADLDFGARKPADETPKVETPAKKGGLGDFRAVAANTNTAAAAPGRPRTVKSKKDTAKHNM